MHSLSSKLTAVAFVFAIAGVVALAIAIASNRRDARLKEWPTTPGRILTSEIAKSAIGRSRSTIQSPQTRSDPSYKIVPVWTLKVSYSYSVDGSEYRGERATAFPSYDEISRQPDGPSERLRTLQRSLAAGSDVPVHFDPDDPSDSYVIWVKDSRMRSVMTSGVALLALGATIGAISRLLARGDN